MKNVLITGASKGIGFEIVKLFLQKKNFNVIALSRNTQSLTELSINEAAKKKTPNHFF